jgi:chromosome segregation ATPase
MDILNGTGRIMDHDAVIAALNRTMRFLTKEETMFRWKMEQLELKHKQDMEEQRTKYESLMDKKEEHMEELKRQLQQRKKATSNLASKVIQTETVVQQKIVSEKRHMAMLEKMEGELLDLNAANSVRKTKIVELEQTIESDRKTIIELTEVIETLRSKLTSICMEEEQFVADDLVKAEANLKAMFETQYVFLKETEKRKELMRERLLTLGIS